MSDFPRLPSPPATAGASSPGSAEPPAPSGCRAIDRCLEEDPFRIVWSPPGGPEPGERAARPRPARLGESNPIRKETT